MFTQDELDELEKQAKRANQPDPTVTIKPDPAAIAAIKRSKERSKAISTIIKSIMVVSGGICVLSVLLCLTFIVITGIYADPFPEKKYVTSTINETGAYVGHANCDWNAHDCKFDEFLIIDDVKECERLGAYCRDPMDRPISYKVKKWIWVAYNSNLLANRTVLYGCHSIFMSRKGCIFDVITVIFLWLMGVSGTIMLVALFSGLCLFSNF